MRVHEKAFPYQQSGAEFLADRTNALLADDMGVGKALVNTAKLLAPTGWVLMGDIRVGDSVIGADGKPVEVIGVYPQGTKEAFKVVFNDGAATECCDDHLWSVNLALRHSRGYRGWVLPLSEIRARGTHDRWGNRRFRIPLVAPVQFPVTDQPIDPYLLGVLLGDGCIRAGTPRFSTSDADLLRFVRAAAPAGLQLTKSGKYDYRFSGGPHCKPNPLVQALRDLGLWGHSSDTKFVPEVYKLASVDQRIAVLQGLLDTDGYCMQRRTVQFSSNSAQLALDVVFLVQSLGGVARQSIKISTTFKCHWIITISLPLGIEPFRIQRKAAFFRPRVKYQPTRYIERIEPIGQKPMTCIRVAAQDGLFVTDDFIVTHNTATSIWGADLACDENILVLCPGIGRAQWGREFLEWQRLPRTVGLVTDTLNVPDTNVVISSYHTLLSYPVLQRLLSRRWQRIICDEAHYLKSRDAARTRAVYGAKCDRAKGLAAAADGVWLLTGTPFPNGPHEAWTHARALFPEAVAGLEAYQDWENHFCRTAPGTWGTRVVGTENIPEFVQRLKPHTLRRLLDDVQPDLPPERYGHVVVHPGKLPPMPVDIPPEIQAVIDAAGAKILSDHHDAPGQITDEGAAAMAYVQSSHLSSLRKWTGIAKAPAVAEAICEDLKNGLERVVIFAVHREVISILGNIIPSSRIIHGDTPEKNRLHPEKTRQYIIDAFQGRVPHDHPRALICQIDIASTNLTLTAACDVAFAESTWVPKDILQGVRRCRRLGQTRPVLAKVYSLQGSLDEVVGSTLVRKANLNSAIEQQLTQRRTTT